MDQNGHVTQARPIRAKVLMGLLKYLDPAVPEIHLSCKLASQGIPPFCLSQLVFLALERPL
jgi:hypothetical protein